MEITPALIMSGLALVFSVVAIYLAVRTERKVYIVPPAHQHKWEIINTCAISNRIHRLTGHLYTLQCEGCGVIKRKRIDLREDD